MGKDLDQPQEGWKGVMTGAELRHEFLSKIQERGLQDLRVLGPYSKKDTPFDNGNHEVNATVQLLAVKPGFIKDMAHFTLVSMPGCCGVMVSTKSEVDAALRRKGVGLLMQEMKEYIARRYRIGKLVATVIKGNKAEESLLLRAGWVAGQPFKNARTGNTIIEWEKVLAY